MAATPVIDFANVQGLVFAGWGKSMPYAAFLFVTLDDARGWLAEILPEIASGAHDGRDERARVQVAWTYDGMTALRVDDDGKKGLPQELQLGMAARSRVLGDEDASDPSRWSLLPPGTTCHALLLLFAHEHDHRTALIARHRAAIARRGGTVIAEELSARWREREPFGFADGLSQPFIDGQRGEPKPGQRRIATGEFLLGYPNQYQQLPKGPVWKGFDLGKDGSYLVFRKLEQDVHTFWQYFAAQGAALAGQAPVPADPDAATTWLASRALGRWPSGASLAQTPDRDDPSFAQPDQVNDFHYLDHGDADGLRCPIGSHVRRANPRDARGGTADQSLLVTDRHRILRRGRAYGPALEPAQALRGEGAGEARGLYFISIGASIARGFEFIQQTWNDNGNFHGMFGDPDPVVGRGGGNLTIAADPVRLRLCALPRFVTTRGGGYFFLPSLSALRKLAAGA